MTAERDVLVAMLVQQIDSLRATGALTEADAAKSLAAVNSLGPVVPLPTGAAEAAAWGRFRRLREHARGGLGEVSVALDEELHREVALKEIQARYADSPDMRARFVREAEITGQLEHPGVVPIYGLGAGPGGRPYYAMRFITGESLDAAIQRGADRRGLLTRFVAVCNAVAFAHSRGVIHRDLKPANVMLGEYGETLVVDWGLARRVGEAGSGASAGTGADGATMEGEAVGTPAFMPPEQARGKLDEVGPHSDVWALGAMLYAILTGKPPYEGPMALIDAAACAPRPRAGVPALNAVCRRAMAAKPGERYASAKELADEVERWLADEPVRAYRDPLSVQAMRWARKRRTVVAALAVLLVGGVIALGVGLAAVRAEQAKTAANLALAREAVDECFNVAKDDPLFQDGGMLPAKKLLLSKTLRFYRAFEQADGSVASQEAEARQAHSVGTILAVMGQREEALRAYRRAVELCQRLADAHTDEPKYRGRLADTIDNMAVTLVELGRPDEALEAYRRAEQIYLRLPEGHLARHGLATSVNNAAVLLNDLGRREEAVAAHARAEHLFQQLADAAPATTPYRINVGRAILLGGNALKSLGRRDEALEAYRRAEAVFRPLAVTHPGVPSLRSELADALNNVAVVLGELGRRDEALAEHRRAGEVRQRLVDAHPAVPEYQEGLAATLNNVGGVLAGLGKPDEALESFRRAEAALRRLADAGPGVPRYLINLAGAARNAGNLLERGGKSEQAAASYLRAEAALRRLVDEHPGVTEYRVKQARTLLDAANALKAAGRPDEALAAFRQAETIRQRLADEHPKGAGYRSHLAHTLNDAAVLLGQVGRRGEALAMHLRAKGIRERLAVEESSRCGELADTHYNLACLFALDVGRVTTASTRPAALRGQDADKLTGEVLHHLRRAQTLGFFTAPKGRAAFAADTDFDAVRRRSDFQAFVRSLSAP